MNKVACGPHKNCHFIEPVFQQKRLVNFAKTSINCLFLIIMIPIFFCGQDNLLGGQFWAMDGFDLLGGQINLLGGQMPTQLTFFFYLPEAQDLKKKKKKKIDPRSSE